MASREKKTRRMDLRRQTRTRNVVPRPRPAKVVDVYLVAHACFACRRSTKKPPAPEGRRCAICGGALCEMGRSFRAPRRSDAEQWRKVQLLYALGFRFFGHRHAGERPLPARLRDVDRFVAENPRHPLRVAPVNKALLPK